MVSSSDDAAGEILRTPRNNGDCAVRNITLDFSPELACPPGSRSGMSGPCLEDSRMPPPHCASFLTFSHDRDHLPPALPRLAPRTEGESVSFVSSNGLVGGSIVGRDRRSECIVCRMRLHTLYPCSLSLSHTHTHLPHTLGARILYMCTFLIYIHVLHELEACCVTLSLHSWSVTSATAVHIFLFIIFFLPLLTFSEHCELGKAFT